MTTMVYRYGLLPPTANAERVREQMRLAHRYRNALVEIERERRAELRAGELEDPETSRLRLAYEAADAAVEADVARVKGARAKSRSRSESADDRAAVAEARVARKAAKTSWQQQRAASREDPARKAASDAARVARNERQRAARAANGLHWGTGAVVDEAAKAAAREPLFDNGEPSDPAFQRWQGDGAVGIQVHQKGAGEHGLSVEELHDGIAGEWLRVAPPEARERKPPRTEAVARARERNAAAHAAAVARGGGRCADLRALSLRIGTDADGAPIVARWPMLMHRPLPADAIVKRALVRCRRIGPREEWYVCLTIETSRARTDIAPPCSGAVALDFGWLVVDGGLRVATWMDQHGVTGSLVLPDVAPVNGSGGGIVGGFERAESLRGTRDKGFDAALAALVAWLRVAGAPDWIRARTVKRAEKAPTEAQALAHLAAWKSPGRLAALAMAWREHRFSGDESAFAALDAWRLHDRHLWAWEANEREETVRRRRDAYRVFAAGLARRYERVVVDDTNFARMAKRGRTEDAPGNEAAAANRQRAAPGELRQTLVQAFTARAGESVKVPAAGLSVTCPACGSSDPAQRDEATHAMVCTGCTLVRDLDSAKTMNLLRAAGCGADVDAMVERGRTIAAALRGGQRDAAE